jgi:peroxin-6
VRQGLLGEDTEIILVTDHDLLQNGFVNGLGTPFSMTSQNDSSSDLDILQFLSLPSSEDDFDNETIIAETSSSLLPPEDDPSSRGIPLRVIVLERPVDKFSLDPRPAESEDDEFRVYTHMRDIARLGIFSGDWVRPSLTSN